MCLLRTLFSDPYYFFASPNFHRFSVINRVPSLLSISSSINRHIHHTMKNHHHLCSVSSSVLFRLVATLCFLVLSAVSDDVAVMNALNKTINLSGTLNWSGLDVCQWKNVQCSSGSSPVQVTSIQLANLNLHGTLPKEIVELSQLQHFDVRQNSLSGAVPYMPKSLRELFVSNNNFTSFPNDFFNGMANLETVSIGYNSFPSWNIPPSLKNCVALISFSAIKANFVGPIPNFVSKDNFPGMNSLTLSFNSLEGELPSSFAGSPIVTLWLNGNKFNGTLEVLQNMNSLGQIWVHGNSFTGPIPEFTSNDQLYDVSLRDNKLTGIVPQSLVDLISLQVVNLTNNLLQGPFPKFKDGVRVDNQGVNRYCTKVAGEKCSPVVETLLFVAKPLGYPAKLAESWTDNNPCSSSNRWLGVVCDVQGKIVVINFQNMGFSGSISPAFANLDLTMLILSGNNLTGTIPLELTNLPALKEVDVSNNNLYGKIPKFGANVVVKTDGNPSIGKDGPLVAPGPGSGGGGSGGRKGNVGAMAGVVVGVVVLLGAGGLVFVMYGRKKKRSGGGKAQNSNAIVLHPLHSGDGDAAKISVVDSTTGVGHGHDGMGSYSPAASSDVQHVEAGNMVISIQVLRQVTDNFSEENILGKGGFGTVYKGELHDGTKIAVKRMESGIVGQGEKGLTEFKSEIAVLTKVRHRHLVALLGHCLDGNEGLLVYEYMPQGPLSKHLFDWKVEGLKPLEWKRRLVIALDVARGVEYLHGLAQHIFIHRDLKPSNILLGDDMRAKVSDFGLVRLAPEGQTSFETRLAGTFGYLAPEYAVTGRVTTKVDIYSYGVILMEMITGRKAIDSSQPEENIHLVTWFRRMLLNKDSIRKLIDPAIDVNDDEEALASFTTVAELASHCCAREPYQRPDMSHVVNVLAPLVEIWKPAEPNVDDIYGIDLDMSLPQALSKWQAFEGKSTLDLSSSSMLTSGENTQSSIPTRPSGFADSFTSSDGR